MDEKLIKYKLEIEKTWNLNMPQMRAANEDIRFIHVPGGMWEDWLTSTHNDDTKRAKMEFDLTSDFVNRYVGEWTLNRAQARFVPDDDATTDDDADILNGMYRSDFKDNDGQVSQDNAVCETAECGNGAYKISTRFVDEGDPENELQETYFEPIFNAFNSVIWDPNAKRADKADAKWCVVITTHTPEAFEEQWPEAKPISILDRRTNLYFDWVTNDLITVAERYEIKKTRKTVHVYQHVEQQKIAHYPEDEVKKIKDELKDDGWEFVRKRKMVVQSVVKTVFNADEILNEEKRIAGKYIPIIPIYGFRRYIDGVERYYGLVRKRKDANRVFNANVSRIAETSAASGDSKPIFSKSQMKGAVADTWANPHENAFMLVNDMVDANGNTIPAGPIGYLQPTQLDPNTVASTEIVNNFLQLVNGSAPTDAVDPDASGKAIDSLRARENLNTQIMSDNILMSCKHSALVWESMVEEIMTDQRNVRVLSVDGEESIQSINTTIMDQETGQLVVANAVVDGKYKVDIEVGPQYESQRDATVKTLESVIALVGPDSKYFPPLMAMWMKNINGTGIDELKEFARQDMLKLGLSKPETEEDQQLLEQLAQQTDPTAELQKAAAVQQQAEAQSLSASAEQKLADAAKKKAETMEILKELGVLPSQVN